ncbi:sugar transferase [Frigidibacter sp. MR17.14]|uniref:sugar transferase n=1 Tax=Frigidibacter sp. MR17.14 TaxID=3126509 RepID=UPI0030131A72
MKDLVLEQTYASPRTVARVPANGAAAEEDRKVVGLYERSVKRAFDILMVLILAPAVLPVTLVFWVLTRLDGSAGFYGQERVGRDGRRFMCWKIRTMVPNAEQVLADLCARDPIIAREWHETQKLRYDPRITRVGQILRKTSLDELPQLWNIFLGEMSFVGPRPFMPSQEHLYVKAGGQAYFRVRPGITGPWQVEGRSTTLFTDRVRYDEGYYQGLSLKGDISYIWKTFGVVLRMTGR